MRNLFAPHVWDKNKTDLLPVCFSNSSRNLKIKLSCQSLFLQTCEYPAFALQLKLSATSVFKRWDHNLLWKVVLKVFKSNTKSSYKNQNHWWIKLTCNTVHFCNCVYVTYTHKVACVCVYIYNILYMNYRLIR